MATAESSRHELVGVTKGTTTAPRQPDKNTVYGLAFFPLFPAQCASINWWDVAAGRDGNCSVQRDICRRRTDFQARFKGDWKIMSNVWRRCLAPKTELVLL